ncbi:hypothetical protein [Acidaminococcus fermentans]|uniref:hypothetical protein n=1 Tax=Acidaminococcus fermentans TaxID=905 RepID=UPI00265F1EA0|nr:hypothetical protein [Acidaminococcus fermentans]
MRNHFFTAPFCQPSAAGPAISGSPRFRAPPFGLLIDERHQVEFFRDRGSPVHAVSLPLVDKNPLQAL